MIWYDFFYFILVALSLSFSSRRCKRFLEQARNKNIDLAIIPGLPFTNGKWSTFMKARVYWAKFLFDNGIVKNVMFSGAAVHSCYCESEIMGLYAEAIGIPSKNVYTEKLAEHSTENVFYSYKLATKHGFKKIALASDPFQTKLLKNFTFKKVDPSIILLPIIFDELEKMEPIMFDPEIESDKAFVKDFKPLKERENFHKRFRGTRGVEMNEEVYD
jgi:uncharacterized SAM-binding protein YcdF (DUF218 family)